MRLSLFALAALGCSHAAPVAPPVAPPPPSSAYDPAKTVEIQSEDIELAARDHQVPATIVAPKAPGKWPAIILMQGSGPTDRNWNSSHVATKSGPGQRLAEELAKHGAVVIRFDKAGAGANKGPADIETWSLDTYRDELDAAIAAARARPDVQWVFLAGHSEGGIHVTRAAMKAGAQVQGIVYLSSAARSVADTLVGQIDAQLHDPRARLSKEAADTESASFNVAIHDWADGKPIEPMKASSIPALQRLLAGFASQPGKRMIGELMNFALVSHVEGIEVPCLVLNGGHDTQVKPVLDGDPLVAALTAAHVTVERHVSPEANHHLEHEPRSLEEIAKSATGPYATELPLDPDAIHTIETWIAAHTR